MGHGLVGCMAGLWGTEAYLCCGVSESGADGPEGSTCDFGLWAGWRNHRLLGRAVKAGGALKVSGLCSHVANQAWQELATSINALLYGAQI